MYDLNNGPKNWLRDFTLKNSLFQVISVVENNYKEKYVYSGYRIAFDGKGSRSFNDDSTRNAIIFWIDNSS